MRRILIAIAGYAFMAWWNNRTQARETEQRQRRRPEAARRRTKSSRP